jgi:chromosome segregation protein
MEEHERELQDVTYQLEQFDKHRLKDKIDKQVEFNAAGDFCDGVDEVDENWREALDGVIGDAKEAMDGLETPESKHNAAFFRKYDVKIAALKKTVADAKTVGQSISALQGELKKLHDELNATKDGLKEEFAETERNFSNRSPNRASRQSNRMLT